MIFSQASFVWCKWHLEGLQEFCPSLSLWSKSGILHWGWWNWVKQSNAARAAAKWPSGETSSRDPGTWARTQHIPVGFWPFLPSPGLFPSLWQQHSFPQACCCHWAVRLEGMAHWSNFPGCVTITDTDAPVSIWALLSILVTAMGVPGGDSSQHRPVGLWGWEGAISAWAYEGRSSLRGCPYSHTSSSLFVRVSSCLTPPHIAP